MKRLYRDNVAFAYEDVGSGSQPFLFVHGWTCNHNFFAPQIEYFSRFHRVIAADLCGHGASDAPQRQYTVTIHGFLTKEGAQYTLAPDSALFLNRHSPAYIGTAIEFLLTPRLREGHARLTEAVRRGGSAHDLRASAGGAETQWRFREERKSTP